MSQKNAGDEAQVRGRKPKVDLAREIELGELKTLLEQPVFRRFLNRVLGFTGTHRSVFATNALTMAHAEGSRNVGLWVVSEILEADPDRYLQMQLEFRKEESVNE